MKKLVLILCLLATISFAIAQTTVISDVSHSGDASAVLDVYSTTKGLLFPRIALTNTSSASPVSSPATSLIVYNTASTGNVTPGYYYWNSAAWVRISAAGANSDITSLTGLTTPLTVAQGGTGAATLTGLLLGNGTSSMTATTSSSGISGVISDETGSGVLVFGTSPTFTTSITSPLIIGGSGTTSDLYLKTTSGVGASGADMHFLVGNNGATEAMTILNSGNIYVGQTANSNFHFFTKTSSNRAIGAQVSTTSGDNYGLFGQADGSGADDNIGVYGLGTGATTDNFGVYGNTTASGIYNFGVNGKSTGTVSSGTKYNYGVNGYASSNSYSNVGVYGVANNAGSYFNAGVSGQMSVADVNNVGVSGSCYGLTSSSINIGVQGWAWDYNAGTGGTALDIAFYGINGHIILDNLNNASSELRFVEPNTNSTDGFYSSSNNYTAFKAQAQSGDVTYTLPAADGSSGQILSTSGSGALSWVTAGAGSGDISSVGSMTVGDAFSSSSADDDWLGLGASAGRIEFDDQTTDEVNILDANIGIGTSTPTGKLDVNGTFVQKAVTIVADDVTPDVSGGNIFITSANTGATVITDIDNPVAGQVIYIIGGSDVSSSTIADSGNFNLNSSWTASEDDVLILFVIADNNYIELGRVNN